MYKSIETVCPNCFKSKCISERNTGEIDFFVTQFIQDKDGYIEADDYGEPVVSDHLEMLYPRFICDECGHIFDKPLKLKGK